MNRVWLSVFLLAALSFGCNQPDGLTYLKYYTIRYVTLSTEVELADSALYHIAHAIEIPGQAGENYQLIMLEDLETGDSVEVWVEPTLSTFHIGNQRYQANSDLMLYTLTEAFVPTEPDFPAGGCIDKTESDVLEHPAAQLVDSFFQWYLCDVYRLSTNKIDYIPIVPASDGRCRLDVDGHIEKLRQLPFFSETFLSKERAKVTPCSNAMEASEGMCDYYRENCCWDITECEFMWYYNWVGGQGEIFDGFEIVSVDSIAENMTSLSVLILEPEGGAFSNPKVEVLNEEGQYRIANIILGY